MTLEKFKEIEGSTCQSENNMNMKLVKEKEIKNDSHERERDTCEHKGAQK